MRQARLTDIRQNSSETIKLLRLKLLRTIQLNIFQMFEAAERQPIIWYWGRMWSY